MILYEIGELFSGATIICPNCKGQGKGVLYQGPCEGDYEDVPCKECDSFGRVVIKLEKINQGEKKT